MLGVDGVWGGGCFTFQKKKNFKPAVALGGDKSRCRTVRIYPLWTIGGPSRHSCLELQRGFRSERLISAAGGAKLLKHQGRILSDFISSGAPDKIHKKKRNPVKVPSVLRKPVACFTFVHLGVSEQVCSTSLVGGGERLVGPCRTLLTLFTLAVLTSCTGC